MPFVENNSMEIMQITAAAVFKIFELCDIEFLHFDFDLVRMSRQIGLGDNLA